MVVTDYNEQFLDKRGTDHLIEELKAYVDGIVNGNIDLSNYVTKSELQAELDALHINIDLSSYATKEELTNAINSIVSSYALKTEIPNKVSELENDSGYLTEHQDLSDYARTADLHSHTNKNVLDDISATDVSNWNDAKVHSQTPHAPSTAQPNFIEDIKVNGASLMISDKTVNIDLSKYAKKTDIPSTDGLATTKYVDNAIANIPTGGDVDLSNYYTKEETNALIPSTEGFATKEYVDNSISNIPTTDLTGYATEEYVNNAISNIPSVDLSNYYTKEETNMLIPSLDGYVTDTELEAKGYLTEHQDLSNYATKDEIPDVSGFITEIPEEYVTETELSAKGYLTEHQDLSAYAKTTDIPTTLPANGGNSDTVNNHTVKSDVPENAVFTDTVYDDTELNAKLNGKADKNAVLNSLEIVNGYTTAQIIPWSDGTHYRGFEDKSSNTYTDIVTKDGVASVAKIENGVMTKLAEVATMDKLNFVPTTRLEGGFKVVAYSDRTITGNSKLECLENWVTNALSKYGDNLVIIGNIFNTPYMDGFAIVNVWGSKKDGILGASGIVVDQEGMYYYKTQNGVPGSGTLTKII